LGGHILKWPAGEGLTVLMSPASFEAGDHNNTENQSCVPQDGLSGEKLWMGF